jgi:hypothetical protein
MGNNENEKRGEGSVAWAMCIQKAKRAFPPLIYFPSLTVKEKVLPPTPLFSKKFYFPKSLA